MSHAWADEEVAQPEFAALKGGRLFEQSERRTWLGKACIAQDNINESCVPAVLPGGLPQVARHRGRELTTRLWCVMR